VSREIHAGNGEGFALPEIGGIPTQVWIHNVKVFNRFDTAPKKAYAPDVGSCGDFEIFAADETGRLSIVIGPPNRQVMSLPNRLILCLFEMKIGRATFYL
jgi:hypothetical protein